MKIGVVCKFPWFLGFGGAEIQAQKYVEYGRKNGCDIDFIDFYNKDCKYDILHFIGVDRSTSLYLASAKQKGIKTILSPVFYLPEKSIFKHQVYRKITKRNYHTLSEIDKSLKLADIILPNSNEETNQLVKLFGNYIENKSKVVYNGFDIIDSDTKGENVYGDFILSVGAIEWRKNTFNLVKAYNKKERDYKLLIIGDFRGGDIEFETKVKKEIDKSNGNIVHLSFISNREEIETYYKNAFAHILPSFVETPGISNLEAAYFNNYLIVGNSAPVLEYFKKFDINIVEPKSLEQISESMDNVFFTYKKDGEKKHEHINNYLWGSVVKDLVEIYNYYE
ncbi:TPA: glycosyltransferase [Photobacterium damselae]